VQSSQKDITTIPGHKTDKKLNLASKTAEVPRTATDKIAAEKDAAPELIAPQDGPPACASTCAPLKPTDECEDRKKLTAEGGCAATCGQLIKDDILKVCPDSIGSAIDKCTKTCSRPPLACYEAKEMLETGGCASGCDQAVKEHLKDSFCCPVGHFRAFFHGKPPCLKCSQNPSLVDDERYVGMHDRNDPCMCDSDDDCDGALCGFSDHNVIRISPHGEISQRYCDSHEPPKAQGWDISPTNVTFDPDEDFGIDSQPVTGGVTGGDLNITVG